jgi:hypothetical protein
MPAEGPLAITMQFSEHPSKLKLLRAFLKINQIQARRLSDTVLLLDTLLGFPMEVANADTYEVLMIWSTATERWV